MEFEVIKNEDHWLEVKVGLDIGLLEWLVQKINADKGVEFAAYRQDHPVTDLPRIIVKTKSKDARELFMEKLEEAKEEVHQFSKACGEVVKEK